MNQDSKPSGGDAAPSASSVYLSVTRDPLSFAPVDPRAEVPRTLFLLQQQSRPGMPWVTISVHEGYGEDPELNLGLAAALAAMGKNIAKHGLEGDASLRIAMATIAHEWVLP